jgi:thiosulfate dehydrogenase [quinone] large subunit
MERTGAAVAPRETTPHDPALLRGLLTDVRFAPLWLALRVALGWVWLEAGWFRLQGAAWPGGPPVIGSAGLGDPLATGLTLSGIALILGVLAGPAAFIGGCLSAGALAGGDVPLATLHFAAVVWLVLAWKTAGWIGLDRWLLPLLGLPWRGGALLDDWIDREPEKRTGRRRQE